MKNAKKSIFAVAALAGLLSGCGLDYTGPMPWTLTNAEAEDKLRRIAYECGEQHKLTHFVAGSPKSTLKGHIDCIIAQSESPDFDGKVIEYGTGNAWQSPDGWVDGLSFNPRFGDRSAYGPKHTSSQIYSESSRTGIYSNFTIEQK